MHTSLDSRMVYDAGDNLADASVLKDKERGGGGGGGGGGEETLHEAANDHHYQNACQSKEQGIEPDGDTRLNMAGLNLTL